MNVLILTGRFGMGHYSVASSLAEDIRKSFDNVSIKVRDLFEYSLHSHCNTLYGAYSFMVSRGIRFYNIIYKCTENSRANAKLPFQHYFFSAFRQLIGEENPDIIISTLPFCSHMVSQYKEEHRCSIPLITCITDVSSHSEWIHPNTDIYLVASPSIRQALIRKGVAEDSIFVNGIPVKESFKQICRPLKSAEKNLLMMGGGLGILPRKKSFYEQINRMEGVKTTIITGNNKELYHKLHGKYENIEVIGFTDQVYYYMHQADLLLSKPGGITLFETVFSELPILAFPPELPQELKNAAFLRNNRIGEVLSQNEKNYADEIADLIYDDRKLFELKKNMRALKNSIDTNAIEKILSSMQRKGMYA